MLHSHASETVYHKAQENMDLKNVAKAFVFLGMICALIKAENNTNLCRQGFFKKIEDGKFLKTSMVKILERLTRAFLERFVVYH